MRYATPLLIVVGLMALVMINAGGGRAGLKVARSIFLVVAGILLLAILFGLFVTKPVL